MTDHPFRCAVCRDTGIVQCPELDGTGMYETACPERVHDLDTGHTRDPKGEEAAAAGGEWTPLDDLDW